MKIIIKAIAFVFLIQRAVCAPSSSCDVEEINSIVDEIFREVLPCQDDEECTPLHKCENSRFDGAFQIDDRSLLTNPATSKICVGANTCCKKNEDPSRVVKTSKTKTTTKAPSSANNAVKGSGMSRCGMRNEKGRYTIDGRTIPLFSNDHKYAQYAEHPYLMAIFVKYDEEDEDEKPEYLCPGTLITKKFVLTSAHKLGLLEEEMLTVRGGEWNIEDETTEIEKHVERKVKKIIKHKGYRRIDLSNDVALLQLTEEFTLNKLISTICLPPAKDSDTFINKFANKRCISVGWGAHNPDGKKVYQDYPKNYFLPLANHEKCQTHIRTVLEDPEYKLDRNKTCTLGEDKFEMKMGDGGGPLLCEGETKNQYYQVGLAVGTVNKKNHKVQFTGWYMDLSKYVGWIEGEILNSGNNKNVFNFFKYEHVNLCS